MHPQDWMTELQYPSSPAELLTKASCDQRCVRSFKISYVKVTCPLSKYRWQVSTASSAVARPVVLLGKDVEGSGMPLARAECERAGSPVFQITRHIM
jgi:hypothetical protein